MKLNFTFQWGIMKAIKKILLVLCVGFLVVGMSFEEAIGGESGSLDMAFDIISPKENEIFHTSDVNFSLALGVREGHDTHLYLNYSLDGQPTVRETIISENIEQRNEFRFSKILPDLSNGQHTLNIGLMFYPRGYQPDQPHGGGSSSGIFVNRTFYVDAITISVKTADATQVFGSPYLFSITVIVVIATVAIVTVGFFVYYRKSKWLKTAKIQMT